MFHLSLSGLANLSKCAFSRSFLKPLNFISGSACSCMKEIIHKGCVPRKEVFVQIGALHLNYCFSVDHVGKPECVLDR